MQNGWPRRLLGTVLAMFTAAILLVTAVLPANAMTITFVRHGESYGNTSCCINTEIPGPGLTPTGQDQADTVADKLMNDGVDHTGIFYSDMIRTFDTAAPFQKLSGLTETQLNGLHEIQAGAYEGASQTSGVQRILYALTAFAWVTGNYAVPMPGSADLTGADFESRFNKAVQTIADTGGDNPVAFSHGLAIMAWTLMNVKNPDLTLMLTHILDNTDIVTVTGSPKEGWTLVDWAGVKVTQNPALPTKLFVNVRDMVTAPQLAIHDVVQALGTRNVAKIAAALGKGVADTIKAVASFPVKVIRSVVTSIRTGTVFKGAAPPAATASVSAATATSAAATSAAVAESAAEPATPVAKKTRKHSATTSKAAPQSTAASTKDEPEAVKRSPAASSDDASDAAEKPVTDKPGKRKGHKAKPEPKPEPKTATESSEKAAA